jgi:gamma-glutamyltranspeptidase/glutathione hydrolase
VDFDSCAPLAFKEGLVTADPESSYSGARSVTVPAVVAGLDFILREYGTKSWSDVSLPAIRLADEGFSVDSEHKRYLDRSANKFDAQSRASLFGQDQLPNVGDRWRQPVMARLLQRLADDGPGAFYEGDIPRAIVRYLHDRAGILSEEDFRECHPQVVEPLHAHCYGTDLYTPPPPSGGLTSLQIVQTVEQFFAADQKTSAQTNNPRDGQYYHVLAEAMKLCWQDRHAFLGDPAFVDVPIEKLLSADLAQSRAEEIRGGTITRGQSTSIQWPHTANVIAADDAGNLISVTATQGWMYGSHLVVDGMGLVLNHGMSRFDYVAGHPNAPAPGKRMQHNMSPMIALRDGQAAFAFGMPGGPKIVSVTAQLALAAIALGISPAESVSAARLHSDGDEPLRVSQHASNEVVAQLERQGHSVVKEADMGGPVNVLSINQESRKIDIASGETTGAVAGL